MLGRIVLGCFFSLVVGAALGQKGKPQAVIVVGRQLSADDSLKIREYFLGGIKEKASQKPNEAEGYFRAVLEIDPANAPALYELAALRHSQKDELNAESFARKAVTVDPANKWYWLMLADVYKQTANMAQLVLVFDELIKIQPNNDDYYFDKANALFLEGKFREADQVYSQIEHKFGESADLTLARQRVYQKNGDSAKAIAEAEKLITADPSELRNYVNLTELYLKSNKPEKAIEVLQKAQLIAPENPFIHLSLADAYKKAGKRAEAFAELKTAVAAAGLNIDAKVNLVLSLFSEFKDPDVLLAAEDMARIVAQVHPSDPKAFSLYGDVLFQADKLSEARDSYKKALQLNDQVYLIWEQLLRIEVAQNDYSAAVDDGEEALSVFPNQAPLYLYTALAYNQQQNYSKAVAYLKNAAELQPDNKSFLIRIYSGLGDAYNHLKRFRESDEAYEKALELDSQDSYVLNNYAYYLSLRGENLAKAAEMSKRCNELRPGNASFEDTYAWVLFKQKKYREARQWIEKAIKTNGSSGVQFEHYGDILFNLGEKNQAVRQWLKAKESGVRSDILDKKINEKKFFE